MDISPAVREAFSLVASSVAIASTFWFWLVRHRREKPRLLSHLLRPIEGILIGANDNLEIFRAASPGTGEVAVSYRLDLAVMNESVLPNAVLAMEIDLLDRDGNWQSMKLMPVPESPDSPKPAGSWLPINLVPMTTAGVSLWLVATLKGTYDGGTYRKYAEAAGDALPTHPQIRVRLHSLRGQYFTATLSDDGTGLRRSEPAQHTESVTKQSDVADTRPVQTTASDGLMRPKRRVA